MGKLRSQSKRGKTAASLRYAREELIGAEFRGLKPTATFECRYATPIARPCATSKSESGRTLPRQSGGRLRIGIPPARPAHSE